MTREIPDGNWICKKNKTEALADTVLQDTRILVALQFYHLMGDSLAAKVVQWEKKLFGI